MRKALKKLLAFLPRGHGSVDPDSLPVEGEMAKFDGATAWLNSEPLTKDGLKGKVVLIDFWTYSCVNCIRTIPHLKAWHGRYADKGFVIVGVHTPEFDFERTPENVRRAVERFGITYPVALDNDYALWRAYRNRYWPAHYFIDAEGNIRYRHFGEGNYGHSETVIRALLKESGAAIDGPLVSDSIGDGAGCGGNVTPETYFGFDREEFLGSPERVRVDAVQRYSSVPHPALGVFYLSGEWELKAGYAVPREADAKVVYRVRASQVNLVMDGHNEPHLLEVRIDGDAPPEASRGRDVASGDMNGTVTVKEGRMYNLVDRKEECGEFLLELTFGDPDVKVYAFTFR